MTDRRDSFGKELEGKKGLEGRTIFEQSWREEGRIAKVLWKIRETSVHKTHLQGEEDAMCRTKRAGNGSENGWRPNMLLSRVAGLPCGWGTEMGLS